MEPAHLLAFNAALLAAIVSPGPALLFIVRASIRDGRTAGVATGLGLAAMAATWTLAALLGLDALFHLVPWAYGALKIGGAAYLLWLAVSIWRHAREPVEAAEPRRARAFWGGVAVNLANPKSVLFSAAVLVLVFPPNLGTGESLIVFANHFLLETACYTALVCALSGAAVRGRYLRAKPVLDRFAAGVLGALGLKLLTDR
jgi:threonine/homoserine/homoserine lactone efflux protein